MKKRKWLVLLCLSCTVGLLSFLTWQFNPTIPKAWDLPEVESMHLPYADSTARMEFISEEAYNKLPVRVSYKTYPFYMPGYEPAGYYDSLRQLDPKINFNEEDLKTEADWIKAGETIYDMPTVFRPLDSAFIALLPVMAANWKEGRINGDRNGIIPFVSITVRQKGKPELGFDACGMCHTKQMPDGRLLKGGQGNFMPDLFRNITVVSTPEFQKLSQASRLNEFHAFVNRLYYAPWVNNAYQERHKQIKEADMDRSLFYGNLPGVQARANASFDNPISIPDLYFLKERKYLDKTGHNLNRGIGDIMRYAILNQNLFLSTSYGGYVPTPIGTPITGPNDYRRTGRFSDAQLYALAKFLYTLKPPPNPEKFPAALLKKGKEIFIQQGCVTCHAPPLYTNNKLTPVDGFEPPASHFEKYDIFNISIGTHPGLSLYTRRGSGYYKVPSLIGAWNRTAFLHDGHLKDLEDLFDSTRFSPNYIPTYFKPIGVERMAVPGHPFGMELSAEEKKALVAFIKSL